MPRVSNLYQIEGIDGERAHRSSPDHSSAEAIQSVDVSTNNYEPELGRSVGAITNVTLKSGTNRFHVSAFEYIQNNFVNARSYFGGPLGHLSYNYFGGALGGPIKKDKLFIFGDILRSDDSEAINSTYTVPDAHLVHKLWRHYRLYRSSRLHRPQRCDQWQRRQNLYDPSTGDGSARVPAHQFTNNQIPISRINPVSLTMLKDLVAAEESMES